MNAPRVSVVIPFLDPPRHFFREAIDSVLALSGVTRELILVDDGSGSEARAVAELAARSDPTVRLIDASPPRPGGVGAARNAGAEVAVGEFLAFLDADDVYLEGRLLAHVTALDENPRAALAFSDTLYWHSWDPEATETDYLPAIEASPGLQVPPDMAVRIVRSATSVPCIHAITVRKAAFFHVGGFESNWGRLYEDQVLLVKLFATRPALFVTGVLGLYRQHAASVTHVASASEAYSARARFLDWIDEFTATLPEAASRRELVAGLRSARWRMRHPRLAALRRRLGKACARAVRWRDPRATG